MDPKTEQPTTKPQEETSLMEILTQAPKEAQRLYFSTKNKTDALVAKVEGLLAVTSTPGSTEEVRRCHFLSPQGEKISVQVREDAEKGPDSKKVVTIGIESSENPYPLIKLGVSNTGNREDNIDIGVEKHTQNRGYEGCNYWWPDASAGYHMGMIQGKWDLKYLGEKLDYYLDPKVELKPDNLPHDPTPTTPAV